MNCPHTGQASVGRASVGGQIPCDFAVVAPSLCDCSCFGGGKAKTKHERVQEGKLVSFHLIFTLTVLPQSVAGFHMFPSAFPFPFLRLGGRGWTKGWRPDPSLLQMQHTTRRSASATPVTSHPPLLPCPPSFSRMSHKPGSGD